MTSGGTGVDDSEDAPRGGGLALDVAVCVGIVAGVVGGTVLLRILGGGSWFDALYLQIIGWVGVLISLAGVLLAYLIFRRQKQAAQVESHRQRQLLQRLQSVLTQVHEKVTDIAVRRANDSIPDSEAEEGKGIDDLWSDVTPERNQGEVYLSSPSGKKRRVFGTGEIPLAVISALVDQWRKQGLTGRWPLSALRGAFRAEGKGNHPWYLVFVPPNDETGVVWKVTRGPGGTDHAVQVMNPHELR